MYCIISAMMLPLSSETMSTDWSRSKAGATLPLNLQPVSRFHAPAAEHQIADVCKYISVSGMYCPTPNINTDFVF
jgi:hypothetical protein